MKRMRPSRTRVSIRAASFADGLASGETIVYRGRSRRWTTWADSVAHPVCRGWLKFFLQQDLRRRIRGSLAVKEPCREARWSCSLRSGGTRGSRACRFGCWRVSTGCIAATVREALSPAWPTPRKRLPPRKSRLDPFKPAIDAMLRADLNAPRKQRHTAKRIFDRLVAEQEMEGISYATVSDYVGWGVPDIRREAGREPAQVFIPQTHRPGRDAEVDFGEVWIDLAGKRTNCHLFTCRMSFSGKSVHRVSASGGQEAF